MTQPLSPEELGDLFQAIENEPTRKLSELARVAGLNLAEDYIGADLSGEDLSEDDLRGINLSRANLSKTNLSKANLSGANLRGANLREAVLRDADLSNADLTNADLTNTDLTDAILSGTLLNRQLLAHQQISPDSAIQEKQLRPDFLKSPVNLSQWLQNIVEESWQTIEQFFAPGEPSLAYAYALRNLTTNSLDAKKVNDLIKTIYTSQDEHLRRQAALRLGEMGTPSSEVLAALVHLLKITQDEETRWSAAESLWQLDPNNRLSGIRRVKDLGMLIGQYSLALMVAVLPKTDEMRAVLLRVYPLRNQKYLPPKLQLVVLDDSGNTFLETEAREQDNYMQLKFSGLPAEQFTVRIVLEEAKITEDFIL